MCAEAGRKKAIRKIRMNQDSGPEQLREGRTLSYRLYNLNFIPLRVSALVFVNFFAIQPLNTNYETR